MPCVCACVQVSAYPPLAPLTLVLKVLLRSCGLNEVANGGLSSFSITNMVLAHILEELQVGVGGLVVCVKRGRSAVGIQAKLITGYHNILALHRCVC